MLEEIDNCTVQTILVRGSKGILQCRFNEVSFIPILTAVIIIVPCISIVFSSF